MLPLIPLLLALAADPPAPAPAAKPAVEAEATTKDVPIPAKIPNVVRDDEVPSVKIRTGENGDRIEEYRQNGRLYMVRVVPLRGPAYTLMDSNGDGRLDKVDGERNGGVAPVYFTLYSWN